MVVAKTWVSGAIVWGSRTIQASIFADAAPAHRVPLATDPEWNELVSDYLSLGPDGVVKKNLIVVPTTAAIGTLPLTLTPNSQDLAVDSIQVKGPVGNLFTVNQGDFIILAGTHGAIPINQSLLNFNTDTRLIFIDSNGSGFWERGETIFLDNDGSGTFSTGDTILVGPTPALGTAAAFDLNIAFWDFDGSLTYTTGEALVYDVGGDGLYTIGGARMTTIKSFTSPLSILGTTGSAIVQVSDSGNVSIGTAIVTGTELQVAFPTGSTLLSAGNILALSGNSIKAGANNQQFTWLNAGGTIDLNAKTGAIIQGLSFFPSIINNGGGAPTISTISILLFQDQFLAVSPTVGAETGVSVSIGNSLVGTPVVTTTTGISIAIGSNSITQTTVFGLDIAAINNGTTRIGIRQQGGTATTNRLASPTRIGDTGTAPTNTLEVMGSLGMVGLTTKTAAYTLTTGDFFILGDATTAAFTLTLPSASNKGMIVSLKKVDATANTVTLAAAGTDTIQGAATVALTAQFSSRTLFADGVSKWMVLSSQ